MLLHVVHLARQCDFGGRHAPRPAPSAAAGPGSRQAGERALANEVGSNRSVPVDVESTGWANMAWTPGGMSESVLDWRGSVDAAAQNQEAGVLVS